MLDRSPGSPNRPLLLAVPNASEGRDRSAIEAIGAAFAGGEPSAHPQATKGAIGHSGARLLDVHTDPDHHRSVFTLAARQGELATAVLGGARAAVARIDLRRHEGLHPRVGALDVAPVVYLEDGDRGAACAEALTAAALVADELALPVFLYGDLATAPGRRERAALRAGGSAGLAARLERGELEPDFGPRRAHPSAGALLVTARPPLLAFNVELAPPATVEQARAIAAAIREGGERGLPGVRAIGLRLERQGIVQVSTNIEDLSRVNAADVVAAVRRHAEVSAAELVALAPAAALEGFPADVPLRGFRPDEQIIERALDC